MQAPPGPPANMCLVDIRPHDSPYGYSSQRATSANTDENNKRGIERHHTFAYELMKGVAVEDRDSEMPDDELNRQLGDNSETSIYAPPRISAQERLQNKLQTMRPLASTYSIEDDGQEVKSRVIRQARQVSQQDKRSGNIGRDDGEYIDAYEDQVVEHGPKRSYRDIRMPPGVFKTADPNLQILSDARPDPVPTDYTNTPWPAQFIKPLGMMVVPTVAEADITWDMVEVLSAALELRIVIIRGHSHDQLDILQAKDCDIIVGTPGKLYCLSSVSRPSITNEHGVEYNLDLSEMAMVVLDCVDVLIKQPLAIHLYDRLRRQDCSHPRTVFTSTWNALTDVYRFFALNPLSIRILQVGTPELALSNVIHHGITIKDNEEFIDMCEKIRQNAHSLGNQVVCVASKLELARTFFQDYAQKYKRRAVLFHAESKNRDIILEGIISGEFSMIVGSEAFLTTFSFPKKVTALIHIDEAASERQYLARLGMIGRQWRYGGMPGISFMLVAKDNARDIRLALRKLAEERPKANISLRDIEQSEDLVKTAITDVQIKKAQISKARLDLHISIVKEGPKVHATRDLVGKSPSTDDHSTTRETEEQHSLDDALD